jgi:hypothetical protein
VRLQNQIVAPHAAPAASVPIASFHEINGAFVLRSPNPFDHLIFLFVHLNEAARGKNRVHGEILMSNVAVGEIAVRELR